MHFTYKTTNKRENRQKITLHPHTKRVNYLCYMRMESVAVCVCMFVCCINKLMCRSVNSVIFYVCLSPLFTWFRPEKKNPTTATVFICTLLSNHGFYFLWHIELDGSLSKQYTHTHTRSIILKFTTKMAHKHKAQFQCFISFPHLSSLTISWFFILQFQLNCPNHKFPYKFERFW